MAAINLQKISEEDFLDSYNRNFYKSNPSIYEINDKCCAFQGKSFTLEFNASFYSIPYIGSINRLGIKIIDYDILERFREDSRKSEEKITKYYSEILLKNCSVSYFERFYADSKRNVYTGRRRIIGRFLGRIHVSEEYSNEVFQKVCLSKKYHLGCSLSDALQQTNDLFSTNCNEIKNRIQSNPDIQAKFENARITKALCSFFQNDTFRTGLQKANDDYSDYVVCIGEKSAFYGEIRALDYVRKGLSTEDTYSNYYFFDKNKFRDLLSIDEIVGVGAAFAQFIYCQNKDLVDDLQFVGIEDKHYKYSLLVIRFLIKKKDETLNDIF